MGKASTIWQRLIHHPSRHVTVAGGNLPLSQHPGVSAGARDGGRGLDEAGALSAARLGLREAFGRFILFLPRCT